MKDNVGVGIDIIIKRDNKLLLGKLSGRWSENEEWALLGSDFRINEKFKDCAERYLKDDVGMKLINYRIISVNNNFWLGNHYINIGVLAETEGEPKLLNKKDWQEWRWFDKYNLPKLVPPARTTLRCFLENKITVSD